MKCDTPIYIMPKMGFEKVAVPCGNCPPCKQRRVNAWVFRLLQEDKRATSAFFITLTYSTEHVPITENGFMTLRKRDFQLFMKRLRKLCPNSTLKYYAVGEYGTQNKRPHYHAILFNVPRETMINEAWTYGEIHVGKVSGDSIAYTMKYIDKPKPNQKHGRDDREREFPLMSKGLGDNYITPQTIAYHKSDISRLYLTKPGGYRIAMPRYYRDKIFSEQEKQMQLHLIQDAVEQDEQQKQQDFERLYAHDPNYTYEQYISSEKYGRHKQFYSKLKERNV